MIIVSGAGGLVGTQLCKRLSAKGHRLLALKHGTDFTATPDQIGLDLGNAAHCKQLVEYCRGAQALVHLAGKIAIELAAASDGEPAPRASATRFAEVYTANVVMTAHVLEVAHAVGVPHLLLASSQTVYGLPSSSRITEDSPLAPLEHYAASKVACERAVALWARGHDRMATVLRFPGIWGEARRAGLVYSLCQAALRTGRVRVGADYPLPIDVLHLDDVAAAFEAALKRTGARERVYNVSTGAPCSLLRLGREIAALVPHCEVEIFGVAQPDIAMDAGRAAAELAWYARPRAERLAEFVAQLRREGGSGA